MGNSGPQYRMAPAGVEAELVVITDGGHCGPGFATRENQDRIATFDRSHQTFAFHQR